MDLKRLEEAVRKAVRYSPARPALAGLASDAGSISIAEEFATAAKTLSERQSDGAGSILRSKMEAWI